MANLTTITQGALYDRSALICSKSITKEYSTSFSLASSLLSPTFRDAIYSIYGFVRLADEVVDTFHSSQQATLLDEFEFDTRTAIERKISLNPILHSFQRTVVHYRIPWELIDAFLKSMRADLAKKQHSSQSFDEYVYGSAEVVGLMCLKVFVEGDEERYTQLLPAARALGSAFQQVNFLRDLANDYSVLGRSYFPGVDPKKLSAEQRAKIEGEITELFDKALTGIRQLPPGARLGVYVAYRYYRALFQKLSSLPTESLMATRVRINDLAKVGILCKSWLRYRVNVLATPMVWIACAALTSACLGGATLAKCETKVSEETTQGQPSSAEVTPTPGSSEKPAQSTTKVDELTPKKIIALRQLYYEASEDGDQADILFEQLESVPEDADPLLVAYRAMSNMIQSRDSYNPINKVSYFDDGKRLLERSIERDPTNPELRFLRYSVQDNAPFFLDYSSNKEEDAKIFTPLLNRPPQSDLERDLCDRIRSYLKEREDE